MVKYSILQIKDIETDYMFLSWERARNKYDPDDYYVAHSGELNTEESNSSILEFLFEKYNIYRPDDFRGHSLSVSDVVEIQRDEGETVRYYCDNYGWKLIEGVENMTETEIRGNWKKALDAVDSGGRLSSIIGWGFNSQDLIVLTGLHKMGLHREKIEDLLEDCNFHHECGLLADGEYEKCLNVILNDIS